VDLRDDAFLGPMKDLDAEDRPTEKLLDAGRFVRAG
jgi:hypothetical protein